MIKINVYQENPNSNLYDTGVMLLNPEYVVSISKTDDDLYFITLPTIEDGYYTDIDSVMKIVGDQFDDPH